MNNNENKKWYLVIAIFTVIITIFGGTLAYWQWTTNTSERTNIALTVKEDFRCDADGGGDISNNEKYLVPTDCMNQDYAIQRTVTVSPTLFTNQLGVDLDLWLTINNIGTGLRNSSNFKYALTKSSTSCTRNVVASGTFKSKSNGSKIVLLDKGYNDTVTETYYLYIWLDKAETSTATMDQDFSISLGGECISTTEIKPEAPVLDDGMIPIKLSSTGVATTVSPTDDTWYNYENKEWANMVLVDSESRSTYLNTTGKTVNEDDILAYYVWIPRYKYRIKDNMSCSELEKPSIDINPECYSYTMSDTDRNALITWWHEYYVTNTEDESYTIEQSTSDINNMLQNGKMSIMDTDILISEFVLVYNYETGSNITYNNGTFNGNNTVIGLSEIDISFEPKIAQVNNGDAVNTYKTHPAFIFGGETIGGIWVGKFETSTNTSSTCYTSDSNCNNTNQEPRILPNVKSLRYQTVSNQFQTSLKFAGGTLTDGNVTFTGSDIYGLTVNSDSHMMKNSEWGAVAYLSHSQYGINQEIYINNSSGYYTGRSGGDVGGKTDTSSYGTYSWTGQTMNSDGSFGAVTDSTLGTKASTTGNVTGVYDMSGGAQEYVMGVLSDSNGKPRSGYSSYYNSGFNGTVYGIEIEYTSGIDFPNSKYYDLYLQSQFYGDYDTNIHLCTLETCGGHALNETAGWYRDGANFVVSELPWFVRGGNSSSGGAFNAYYGYGYKDTLVSWRSVVVTVDGA